MKLSAEKQRRLAHVAKRYYIDDQKQSDIGLEMGVSRPMISKMLQEAREFGVVEIIIHTPEDRIGALLEQLKNFSSLRDGILVEDEGDGSKTNIALCQNVLNLLQKIGTRRMGIGWGYFIGQLINLLEANPPQSSNIAHLCPLLGNAGNSIRNYHTNENVRIMAQQFGAKAHYLNLPALPESLEEKEILCSTELYRQIEKEWSKMDTILVSVGNFPSTPDFASGARYGDLLQKQKACGKMLAYYYNVDGTIIHSDHDFAIQIPLDFIKQCKNVIGVCSANTNAKALRGALNTGLLTHIVARAELVKEAIR